MTTTETRRFEMLQRVREFGQTHRNLFPETGLGGQAFTEIATTLTRLSEQAVSKMSAARGGKRAKAISREALVSRLEAICRSARVIAKDNPGFDDAFHLPRPQSDQALLTTGRVFVRQAEAMKERFIAYEMPDNFVASLTLLVDEFEQAIRSREAGRDGHTAARASIDAALSAGLAAVRKLDIIVANRLHDDPVTMAVWERDRRVDYFRRTRKVTVPAPVVPDVVPVAVAEPRQPEVPGAIVDAKH